MVRHGENIYLDKLGISHDVATQLDFDNNTYAAVATRDLSTSKGVIHFRQALIGDASFQWSEPPVPVDRWDYLLRIDDERGEVSILFDMDSGQLKQVGNDHMLGLTKPAGFQSFLEEQFQVTDRTK